MKKYYLVPLIAIALLFLPNCTATKGVEGVWVNKEKTEGKSFSKILLIVLTADVEARQRLENDLVAAAAQKGITAVPSLDILPMDIKDPKLPTREEVVGKVKASGCDGVFIGSVLKKDEKIGYTEGGTTYAKAPYYVQGGDYFGYFSNWHPVATSSSYYSHDKTYYMLSNLYDVATEEIMWSIKSEVFDPSSLASFSRLYTKSLFSKLQEAKLLKKK